MKSGTNTELIYDSFSTSIYKGAQENHPGLVLTKILKKEGESAKRIAQLENEFLISKKINSSSFRKVLEKTIIEGQHALIQEYIEGKTLKEAFANQQMQIDTFLDIAIKSTELLSVLHRQNIIHKDINSNNILYREDQKQVYIIDFNIASEISLKSNQLENPEKLEGTLQYISPEQTGRVNRIVDFRSDLYSLGITFFELLCGSLPFNSDDALELLHFHIARKPPLAHQTNANIPETLSLIIDKLLSKNAEDRFQSAYGLLHDLKKCRELLQKKGEITPFELGENDFSNDFRISEKLYGREGDIKDLLESFDRVSNGAKELVLVKGASGTGKSALISEIHKPITEKKGIYIAGKFDQFQRNNPYFAISQAFKGFCKSLLTAPEEVLKEWKEKIQNTVGENGEVLIEIIPQLALIIGKQPTLPALGAVESQNRLNFVFQNFIKAIARPDQPLALFIDDMQWADNASLNLLYALLSDKELHHFMIILSYRDNEVDEAHPFSQMLRKLQSEQLATSTLTLSNLESSHIIDLVQDAFLDKSDSLKELAGHIQQKTNGNAFFVNQFLTTLYRQGCITAEIENRRWVYDKNKVNELGFSDNVLELMMRKVDVLPNDVKDIMQIAAVIGSVFSLEFLASIKEVQKETIAVTLKKCLQENLIVPISDNYSLIDSEKIAEDIEFKFIHDRIQQAFYQLSDNDETSRLHLAIGRNLMQFASEKEETIFDMVNHLNEAIALIQESEDSLKVAHYNAMASEKAMLSSAFGSALNYAIKGMEVLEGKDIDDRQNVLFHLSLARAEAEHLSDNDEAANKYFDLAIYRARSKNQVARAYEKKIHFYTNIGEFKKAYATGSEVLKKVYSINLPSTPSKPALIIQMLKTKSKFRGQPIRDFVNHPVAQDEEIVSAVKLIAAILKSAYQIKPELAVANAMVMVNLCMKHGNTADSAIGYLVFGGIFLGGILGMRKTGNLFGQLAIDLNEKFKNATQKSEVLFVNGYFATSWLNPIKDAESYFQQAYEVGLETGDLFHTGCSCCAILQHQLIKGTPLAQIEKNANNYLELLQKLSNNKETIGTVSAIKQAVLCYKGETSRATSFDSDDFSEEKYAASANEYVSQHFAHYFYLNKLFNQFLNSDFEESNETLKKSASLMEASAGMLHSTEHYFLQGLITSGMAAQSKSYLKPLKSALNKFKKWSQSNPENFEAKYLLLDADYLSLKNKKWQASKRYSEALEKAKKDEFNHLIPVIHEKLSILFESDNRMDESFFHMQQAIVLFQRQGFNQKHDQLSKKQQNNFRSTMSTYSNDSTSSTSTNYSVGKGNVVDINTIIKSAQTLSGEVVLSNLLEKVMHLVIENAGAEKGFLLIKEEQDQQWYVEAECNIENKQIEVLKHIPLKAMTPRGEKEVISAGIVNYVMRTKENVVLNDASKEGNFTSDEHILNTSPKSILCIPLIYKGKMTGILYLENNLSYGAFNAERIEILNMLTTQMAISIDNAMLYENLEEKVQERTSEVVKQKEIIEQKNENITASIKYAERIQNASLPTNESISASLKENFILFKPRDIVSGDFYWFAENKKKVFIAAIDCTGHGVPGAFMSLVGDSHLTQIVKQNNILQPGKILDSLHNAIQKSLKQKESQNQDGMDAALCGIDFNNNTLEFAGANNPLVMVKANGEMEIIKANKMAIGGKRKNKNKEKFTNHIVSMEAKTTYYLFSDGYADQFGGPDDRKFMVKRFKNLLQEIANEPMEQQKEILEYRFNEWKADKGQVDDILVIGFRTV
ncbi:AAA family ATPase [Marivirga sp. S37H4]|uniref:AAA family ATPase n=1 Tax=Marivirga aurantiaca TaxID=2802615 RepID=A0A934X131_9BACT|nr:AAA family ATPase [Marivirga aurantiaca]MBK6266460.1 AAA family ATPase [Marivirga aurantiaca]